MANASRAILHPRSSILVLIAGSQPPLQLQSPPMGRILPALIGLLLCTAASQAQQPKTWEYGGGGKWKQTSINSTRPAAAPLPNPTIENAQRELDAHRPMKAHDIILPWIKANPHAPDRDRAMFILAQADFDNGEGIWCFYEC